MPGTMTFVGMDVHARSIHAAAIDVMSGELSGCVSPPVIGHADRVAGVAARPCMGVL